MKNVFIIGAGANNEIKMPTGIELKKKIIECLYFQFDFGSLVKGNIDLLNCIKIESNNDIEETNKYLEAARDIHDALPQAISIDNYLDARRDDKYINFCGKLGIVYSILEAERRSSIYVKDEGLINFNTLIETWYHPFFQIITENCSRDDVLERLHDVGFVIFNYDRCFEQYFSRALENYYKIPVGDANYIVNEMKIIHPYGSVGNLPFQNKKSNVRFGENCNVKKLHELAHQIRTFTESKNCIIDGNHELDNCISNMKKVVFLGFAFHKLNMNLLFNTLRNSDYIRLDSIDCFGSAYNISNDDIKKISKDISEDLKTNVNIHLQNLKCYDFINHFWRSLTF